MPELNENQKNKLYSLLSAADIVDNGNFAVLSKILEFQDLLEEYKTGLLEIPEINEKIGELKNEYDSKFEELQALFDGNNTLSKSDIKKLSSGLVELKKEFLNTLDTTKKEILSKVPKIIKIESKDGLNGKDGKDAYTPKKGVDYFTQEDINIVSLNALSQHPFTSVADIKNAISYEKLTKSIEETRQIAVANSMPVTTSFFNGLRAKNLTIANATAIQNGDTVTITPSLTIGGTITGGTANSVLFINPDATLAQDNTNFTYNDTTNLLTLGMSGLGVTAADSLLLKNFTAAALNAQQISPSLHLSGNGWATTGSTSLSMDYIINVLPVQGSTTISGSLQIISSVNGGAGITVLSITSAGTAIFNGAVRGGQSASNQLALGVLTSSNLVSYNSNTGATDTTALYLFGGASSVNFRTALGGATNTINLTANNNYSNTIIASSGASTATTGTHAFINNLTVKALGAVTANGAAITNTASFYIEGASSAGSNNYALYSASGTNYLGGSVGILSTIPTHTLTLGSTGTGIALYNTTDQTVNYERVLMNWTTNVFTIATGNAGTGTGRALKLQSNFSTITLNAGTPGISFTHNTTGSNVTSFSFAPATLTGSTGTNTICSITPTYNQTSTAGTVDIKINRTETALGSGTHYFADFQVAGTSKFTVDNTGNIATIGAITTYKAVATAGWGVPAIYGSGRSTGQTAAVASVTTYTVGAADGSFIISANANITAFVAGTFNVTVAYTDETNTAQTLKLNFSSITGTIGIALAAAGPFEGIPAHIRCKAATAITVATSGTFTSLTYNVEGSIRQIA